MRSSWEDGPAFLVWALDDIRAVDELVWQHIAPRLHPEIQREKVIETSKEKSAEPKAMALDDLFTEFAMEQIRDNPQYNLEEVDRWISGKLVRLKEYDSRLKAEEIDNLAIENLK